MPLEIITKDKQKKNPHLAFTHNELQGGAANGRNVSLLMKATDDLPEDLQKALENLGININKMYTQAKFNLLTSAIKAKFADDEDDVVWVEDYDETTAIFCMECCLYSVKYTMSGDSVEVGDSATPVVRGVVYNTDTNAPVLTPEAEEEMDSETYALVYKAIQNNSEKIAEVFKATKKEGSDTLPASAYAYTPDKSMPSTWKLRIDDANHTSAAVAALGEGFRGNKVQIPSESLAAVKRKVRAAYKKFYPEKDLPPILKSNQKEPTLKEEIQKALGEAEALFKAQLKEKDEALEKALQEIQSLKKSTVEKAREDALSFVADEAKRKELVKSLEAVDEASFAVIVKAMKEQHEVEEQSDLMKQMSVHTIRTEDHQENSFDALMKAKYAKQ